ncbi:hypothetical protein B0H14DRAFT_3655391 [Mycena olivaceomarginata]|nr:hypothetical protein B0H14DRAFT_3655391 [Mycena olivaceomarginata]
MIHFLTFTLWFADEAQHAENSTATENLVQVYDVSRSAVRLHREALGLCRAPHPNLAASLDKLANSLRKRFEQKGDAKDLYEAIELHRKALDLSLNNLANSITMRLEQRTHAEDIDDAIRLYREALTLCPARHPDRASSFNNLAASLYRPFEQRGDAGDMDEAIQLYCEALVLRLAPHPGRAGSLNNRFKQRGDAKDLDEAIKLHREALDLRLAPHPDRVSSLNNLANSVRERFQTRGAVALHREALALRPVSHPVRASALNNLAASWGHAEDMEEAIRLYREVLSLHFAPYSDRASALNNLATCLVSSEVSAAASVSPLARFQTAKQWATTAHRSHHSSALEAYSITLGLLLQLAISTCAIELRTFELAIELLEAGRSIFWAQALHLRTPLDHLANVERELAIKLKELSQQLERASFRDTSQNRFTNTQHQVISIEAEAARCRQLNEDWEKAIKSVRKLAGFEDFMRPKGIASLRRAALSGPVIILLASSSTCSALVVKPSEGVQHVQLPALNVQTVEHYADLCHTLSDGTFNVNSFLEAHGREEPSTQQSDLEARLYGAQEGHVNMSPNDIFCRLLAGIWQTVVKPVFEKSENPSRLWWCPTGPFGFLPIHAAGVYNNDGTEIGEDSGSTTGFLVPAYKFVWVKSAGNWGEASLDSNASSEVIPKIGEFVEGTE